MKKLMMCAAFIAAMATFTTVNAQDVKTKKCPQTEQCCKQCGNADCKKAACKDCKAINAACKDCTCGNAVCKDGKCQQGTCKKACDKICNKFLFL